MANLKKSPYYFKNVKYMEDVMKTTFLSVNVSGGAPSYLPQYSVATENTFNSLDISHSICCCCCF